MLLVRFWHAGPVTPATSMLTLPSLPMMSFISCTRSVLPQGDDRLLCLRIHFLAVAPALGFGELPGLSDRNLFGVCRDELVAALADPVAEAIPALPEIPQRNIRIPSLDQANFIRVGAVFDSQGVVAFTKITFAESTWKRVITNMSAVPAVGLLILSKLQAQLFA